MSSLEWIAAPLGIVSVTLTVRRHIAAWPIGAVMVALYIIIFWREKLYADAVLQGVFFILQLYGWWGWYHSAPGAKEKPVRALPSRWRIAGLLAGAALTVSLGLTLHHWTDQSYPIADSGIAVFSLIAQALMALRYWENWPIWIGVDLVAVTLYCLKSLYATAVLYAIFIGLAVAGLRQWRKAIL